MAEVTNPPPERRGIPLAGLPEELVLDILLRLPPKSILRCRAVCKAWRCITTDRDFLLAHHGRQPSQRLFSFVRNVGRYGSGTDLNLLDYCVEAMDFRSHEFRSVVRFTGNDYSALEEDDRPFTLHAACDGLLLMSYDDSLYICNPATRQWASVCPPTLDDHKIAGLYVHGSSGEYRMLSYREVDRARRADIFFITTVGSNNVNCIRFGSYAVSMRNWLARGSKATEFGRPFLSHGKLHWLPRSNPPKNILVFDTVAEEFSWLPSPVMTWDVVLLEMEGTLAMSRSPMGASKVDLWVLQDYKSAVWVLRYQIEFPVPEICVCDKHKSWTLEVVSPDGDVLVDFMDRNDWQLHYDMKGNLLRKFLCNGSLQDLTTHILKESLVPHAFFHMQEDGSAREPPFFWGL